MLDRPFDEVYQLAADMGGAGYLFTGDNDALVMRNSAMINLNVVECARLVRVGKLFFSSSACVYPTHNQQEPDNPTCPEDSVYPADPDCEYGWEKLFAERLYLAYSRNHGIPVRIARFHNVFGPEGCWTGGRGKAPAAICRKVAEAEVGGEIEVWGDGEQTRTFLYADDCLEAVARLMRSEFAQPLNVGSTELVTINQLAEQTMAVADKPLGIRHVEGPQGVRGRTSDNTLIEQVLGWQPTRSLAAALRPTYRWIAEQVVTQRRGAEA